MDLILKKLISFPTISQTSNKEMVTFIDSYLKKFNLKGNLVQGEKNHEHDSHSHTMQDMEK